MLNAGVATPPLDMTAPTMQSVIPAMIGYADINTDIDVPPGLGCTNQVSACHGGTNPSGMMMLVDMAAGDMTKLMANYTQVTMRVNTQAPASSLLLLKLLSVSAGGTPHTGGNSYFADTNAPMYQRWLVWIKLGAQFPEVSTMMGGGGGG